MDSIQICDKSVVKIHESKELICFARGKTPLTLYRRHGRDIFNPPGEIVENKVVRYLPTVKMLASDPTISGKLLLYKIYSSRHESVQWRS